MQQRKVRGRLLQQAAEAAHLQAAAARVRVHALEVQRRRDRHLRLGQAREVVRHQAQVVPDQNLNFKKIYEEVLQKIQKLES